MGVARRMVTVVVETVAMVIDGEVLVLVATTTAGSSGSWRWNHLSTPPPPS